MTQNKFPSVWYASEEKIKSASKLVVFDDRGSLDISGANIQFTGKKNNIQINKSAVKNISITRQKINWITYLIVNVLSIVYFIFTGMNIIFLIILLVIGNGFGLLINSSTKWVLIEYLNQNRNLRKAYFANGSMFGWSGLFGGTQKIYDFIRS